MRTWGSRYARLILEKCDRNKRQACEVLGISYHTLNAYLNYQPDRPRGGNGSATARAAVPVVKRGPAHPGAPHY
jgi:hypothetical protein